MNKPIGLMIYDTKQGLIDVLNNSGLPVSVLSMIMNEVNSLVREQERVQLNQLREQRKQQAQQNSEQDTPASEA
jgi:heme exporter protein D